MAKMQAVRKEETETKQPVNIGDRAFDNLRFIRETMERSTHFTAVPGYGGIFMGLTAIAASVIAFNQTSLRAWLSVWLTEAALAFAIGLFATWQKSKIARLPLTSAPARKFANGFLPPLICGVILTLGLWRAGHFEMMIPAWLLLYGAAVVTGGAFSVKAVPVMGWCFIALGATALLLPAEYGNWLMLLGFGVLHVVFGIVIARKFGG
ncbi:MAG TPA: hypothetical protein VK400_14705 [Pyrinomonadaceae bacterium]|nr:hypothetical protein [Pyrinomonadaceae bacterium]